ncbi:hypothetical protein BO70DRAFT_208281 [Aspergillus heteromorphus CBS 117.55]|uniref:Uncharacterized protein n=1 Tax=Aspergillus heteromorphus CBS 117.55 TaxID=1448321 RepID=A0A317UU50_9EURO|nr:uncharacterized protein BO70DRAFT_208281 [Aspergillus heteromorphus CBS 117.55]PWY64067.1 hypothetical protein BO70DRAFT_208281 [Aspergillus heteromorphus CBS 117.55]
MTAAVQRPVWIFREAEDGREVNQKKWSKVDIRFRGVFKSLKKVPQFEDGVYEENGGNVKSLPTGMSFKDSAKAQSWVVYALLDEILNLLDIRQESEDEHQYFYLRPRLLGCSMEYWTGYRVKHKDAPNTAGWIAIDHHPDINVARCIMPVSTTTTPTQTPSNALATNFQHLLGQLLIHVLRLHPAGDQLPDQEIFLIGLHGSKLHLLRGIFQSSKTSRVWCGHHNTTFMDGLEANNLATLYEDRYMSAAHMERFAEQLHWLQLSRDEPEASATESADPSVFRVLSSKEYDLWLKDEFKDAVRLISALAMYLMSGQARCGILQEIFELFPYGTGLTGEDKSDGVAEESIDDEIEREQLDLLLQEIEIAEMEEKKALKDRFLAQARDSMRETAVDRIGGLRECHHPWWDWVWDDEETDGKMGVGRN